jgi:hypothetical protein
LPERVDVVAIAIAAQQVWLSRVMELAGERLPALSIACTLYVFELCVPFVIQRSVSSWAPSKTPLTYTS